MPYQKAKVKDRRIREICERNNINFTRFAADMGVTLSTVYGWQSGRFPFAVERAERMEAEKRAAGEYPVPGAKVADQVLQAQRERMLKARSLRRPDWQQKQLETNKKRNIREARIQACKRNFVEVAAAELESSGRKLKFYRFYCFTHKRTDGVKGFVFEGEKQLYYFD